MKWIIGEPSQENVYTYSYWNKIWNGSLVNLVKKMYIPIPTEKNMKWIIGEPSQENVYTYSYWNTNEPSMYIPIPTEIKYEMDHWWTQSRKCIYLFLLK